MSNTFGEFFKVTTFGESHGLLVGAVIDGFPPGLEITEDEINQEMEKRKPGLNEFSSQRKEEDKVKIVSGVFEGKTTGAPICLLIENTDAKPSDYQNIKNILKPSHFNFTYLQKYKFFDYRGSGRASARETAARVAAGAIAKKLLKIEDINIYAYVKAIGEIEACINYEKLKDFYNKSLNFCPDKNAEIKMIEKLKKIKEEKDSIGGVVEFYIENVPAGLGEPIFDKLNAKLAYALMSIPAVKGIEIGDGFEAAKKVGSLRNDRYILKNKKIATKTNNEGGIIAGISSGMPIVGRVAFKPTPTIGKNQSSLDIYGNKKILKFPKTIRRDVCVAIRAVAVVEAMCSLVLADSYLLNQSTHPIRPNQFDTHKSGQPNTLGSPSSLNPSIRPNRPNQFGPTKVGFDSLSQSDSKQPLYPRLTQSPQPRKRPKHSPYKSNTLKSNQQNKPTRLVTNSFGSNDKKLSNHE